MAPINKPGGKKPHATAKAPPGKPTPKPNSKPKTVGYDWGNGRGGHSIPLAQHQANVQGVKDYGVTPDTPLDQPLSSATAYGMAQAAASREYAPQIDAVKNLQTSVPTWYADAIARIGVAQEAQKAYAQPVLDQAAGWANAAASLPPGMDPNSPEAAAALQASRSGQGLAQLGADTLAAIPTANQGYLSGQAGIAARELPQVQAGYTQQLGQLGSQREEAATKAYGDIRTNEQNASIARETLGLNTSKAISDAQSEADALKQTAKDKKAARVVSRKNTRDRITAAGVKTQTAADKAAAKDAEKTKAAETKKAADIQKSTGKVKVDVTNVIDAWNSYRGQQTDDTSKPQDPVTHQYPGRPVTPADIKRILGQKHDAGLIHVALLVRAHKPLDKAAIDYLHSKDPNIRIPREWLGKPKKDTRDYARPGKAPSRDYQPG